MQNRKLLLYQIPLLPSWEITLSALRVNFSCPMSGHLYTYACSYTYLDFFIQMGSCCTVYYSAFCFSSLSYMSFHIGTYRTISFRGTETSQFKIIPILYRFPEVIVPGQRACTCSILIDTAKLSFNNLNQFIVHKSDCFPDFFLTNIWYYLTFANLMGKNKMFFQDPSAPIK